MNEKEISKLKALSDVASIDISLEFNGILQNILKITCTTMNAHAGTVMLIDEGSNELKLVASYGLPDDYIARVYEAAERAGVQLTSSPSGAVLETGKYYLVPNVFEEPRGRPWWDLSRDVGFSAIIFTPMKKGLKVIGLLNVYMARPHSFTEEEIDFVSIAASQASSVVQNARICTRLKNNIQELEQYRGYLERRIKEAHKGLYESEKYLRTIIESSIDGIAVVDDHGRFEFGNNSFYNIIGWPREEIIGQFFIKVIQEDFRENMMERWRRFVLERNSEIKRSIEMPYETKIMTKSGEKRVLNVSHAHTEINGKSKYVVIIKDISEKKELELELKDSVARYRDLFENADEPMFTLDTQGYFVDLNNAGLRTLGSTKDELVGTHISSWLAPESFEVAQAAMKKRLLGEPVEGPTILELVCKNGEHRWVDVKSRVLKEGDRIIGLHGVARDITEKRRLEKELKDSEERYRELFENADDPMYTIDTEGRFLTINNTGLKILGCTKEEVLGTHISQWLTPESFVHSQEILLKQIMGLPFDQPVTIEVICKDGEHRWGDVRTRVIRKNGTVAEIHGIARDITEKKILEQKLREYHGKLEKSYEELKEADRLKTEFVSNITHELFTPTTSIRGFAELMHNGDMGRINDKQKKGLETILRNSDRLVGLVKDMLDVVKLENNKLELQLKPVSIRDILLRSIQDLMPQTEEKQINIIHDIPELPEIYGDEERLTQAIINVLSNAVKFTPIRGKITIEARGARDEVKISIADTGAGIPADKLSRIFDRFYQVDGSTRRKYGGAGLGLSICKNIIDKHDGLIWAESDKNGSTFHIVLPKFKSQKKEVDG